MNRNLRLMYLVGFVSSLHFFGGVLTPIFTVWAGLPKAVIPQIQLWFMVWSAIFEVPTGIVADKFGAKASVVLGLVVSAVGISVYVIRPHIAFFLLGELLVALGFALISGADISLLFSTVKSNQSELLSENTLLHFRNMHQNYRRVGTLLGTLLGGVLAVFMGYQWVYWFSGAAFLVAALFCLRITNAKSEERIKHRSIRDIIESAAKIVKFQPAIKSTALDFSIVSALTGSVIWFNQMILEEIGFPPVIYGLTGSIGMLMEMSYSATSARLQRRLGMNFLVGSAYLPVVGISISLIALKTGNWVLAVIGIAVWFTIIDGWISLMDVAIDGMVPESEFNTIRSTVFSLRKLMIGGSYVLMSITLTHSVFMSIAVIGGALLSYNLLRIGRSVR